MAGGGVVPNPLLAQLIRSGAKVVPLPTPCAETEARYRPSVGLQRFVRSRDLSCRFPGCDHPAEFCDLDHTVPYEQGGKTHASNIKCLCSENPGCTSAYGRRNEFRRNPPLRRGDGEEMPLAGHALELVSAAVLELES